MSARMNRSVATTAISPVVSFSYENLSPSVENILRGQAERIRRQCANSIIQIRKALIESKRDLSHGVSLLWVEPEIGLPARTAIHACGSLGVRQKRNNCAFATLGLHMPSSNGVPEDFVLEVLKRVEASDKIAASAMRQELQHSRRMTSTRGRSLTR
jgi:hypothetical protein